MPLLRLLHLLNCDNAALHYFPSLVTDVITGGNESSQPLIIRSCNTKISGKQIFKIISQRTRKIVIGKCMKFSMQFLKIELYVEFR